MTKQNQAPQAAPVKVPPAKAPAKQGAGRQPRRDIRLQIMMLALLPAVLMAGISLANIAQAHNQQQHSLLNSARLATRAYSTRIDDLRTSSSGDLNNPDPQFSTSLLVRGKDISEQQDLKVDASSIYNNKGELISAYDGSLMDTTALLNQAAAIKKWQKERPQLAQAMNQIANEASREAIKNKEEGKLDQVTLQRFISMDGHRVLLNAASIGSAAGVSVLAADARPIDNELRNQLISSLLLFGLALLGAGAIAASFGRTLATRVVSLAESLVRGAHGDEDVKFPITGNDQLTDASNAGQLLYRSYKSLERTLQAMEEE